MKKASRRWTPGDPCASASGSNGPLAGIHELQR
jgi:hypothetical protein